jgi:hypothetical protein
LAPTIENNREQSRIKKKEDSGKEVHRPQKKDKRKAVAKKKKKKKGASGRDERKRNAKTPRKGYTKKLTNGQVCAPIRDQR